MRILLIEDDITHMDELKTEVEKQYVVDVAYNGVEGTYLSQVNDYDAIVVDSSLPDMDGLEVCKKTRSAKVDSPILFLADGGRKKYKLDSLDAGADAFLSKPVDKKEFKAKLRALLRRRDTKFVSNLVKVGVLEINFKNRVVRANGKKLDLRRREYDILEYLVVNQGRVVSKEEILEHVWHGGLNVFSNTVEVHIKNLRDKLEKPFGEKLIHTVRGFGYKVK